MRELLFLITLVLGVAIGFAGCGDDDEKTDVPVESSVDAGVEEAESDAAANDAGAEEVDTEGAGGEAVEETEEATGGTGGEAVEEEAVEEEADAGEASEDASEAAGGSESAEQLLRFSDPLKNRVCFRSSGGQSAAFLKLMSQVRVLPKAPYGWVVELVYTADLKSAAERIEGSSPSLATNMMKKRKNKK